MTDFQETNYDLDNDLSGLIQNEWGSPTENDSLTDTLDEPVIDTLLRDLNCILTKFKYIFNPGSMKNSNSFQSASRSLLKDWDLWGPLLNCVALGLILHDDKSDNLFTLVFLIVFLGSLTVTLNTKLLGGTVSILQSICVLGYCLGPLVLSLPAVKITNLLFSSEHFVGKVKILVKLSMVLLAVVWSCRAAMRFMVSSVDAGRKVLAVYPICLFYSVIAWMIMTQ